MMKGARLLGSRVPGIAPAIGTSDSTVQLQACEFGVGEQA